jgi:hypothetical protein
MITPDVVKATLSPSDLARISRDLPKLVWTTNWKEVQTLIDSIPDGTLISVVKPSDWALWQLTTAISCKCPLDMLIGLIKVLDFKKAPLAFYFDESALDAIDAIVEAQPNSQYTNWFGLGLLLKRYFFAKRVPPPVITRPWTFTYAILLAHTRHASLGAPEQASVVDETGKLPLHWACQIRIAPGSSLLHYRDVIVSLLKAYPEGVKIANPDGLFPLHLMINTGKTWDEGISELVRAFPEVAKIPTRDGLLPLHLMINAGKDWLDGVREIVGAYPEAVKIPTPNGLLPLHLATNAWMTWRSLVEAYPEGVKIATPDGLLPLHLMINTGTTWRGGICELVRAYPEGVEIPTPDGLLPLHLMIIAGTDWHEGIDALVEVYPEGVKIPTPDGLLPLHLMINAERLGMTESMHSSRHIPKE